MVQSPGRDREDMNCLCRLEALLFTSSGGDLAAISPRCSATSRPSPESRDRMTTRRSEDGGGKWCASTARVGGNRSRVSASGFPLPPTPPPQQLGAGGGENRPRGVRALRPAAVHCQMRLGAFSVKNLAELVPGRGAERGDVHATTPEANKAAVLWVESALLGALATLRTTQGWRGSHRWTQQKVPRPTMPKTWLASQMEEATRTATTWRRRLAIVCSNSLGSLLGLLAGLMGDDRPHRKGG